MKRLRSPDLGRVDVIRDREGLKLLVSGKLYSVRQRRPEATPTVWLLLAAAPLLTSPDRRRGRTKVALLGYGGGTVARLLKTGLPGHRLTGLEPDAAVRAAARSALGSDIRGVTLISERAETFLAKTRERFDAILDDVFAPAGGRLARPETGVRLPELSRVKLRRGGVYAVNLISPSRSVERRTLDGLARSFRYGVAIATRDYAHRVIIGSDHPIPRGGIARALRMLLEPAGVEPARLTLRALGISSVRRLAF